MKHRVDVEGIENFSLSGEECSTSSSDNEDCSTLSTSTHCLMAKGNKKVNNDDDNNPSYDELMDMLEELNEYIGEEKSRFKVLKKEFVLLQDNYDVLKDEHEKLLLNEYASSKVDIGITCNLLDDLPCIAPISCNSSKVSISTSCDDLINLPCSSSENIAISSMFVETNLVEENKKLKACLASPHMRWIYQL